MSRLHRFAAPRFFFALGFLLLPLTALATDYYVAPNGSPSGDGSIGNPWDLQTALNQPAAVQPGDTIWLRGGTYISSVLPGPGARMFVSKLNGTAANPIVVRQYPGERPTISTGASGRSSLSLFVRGSYTWFWGFEITSTYTNRVSAFSGDKPPDQLGARGPFTEQAPTHPGLKFINLIIHDIAGQSMHIWKDAVGAELNGCLIYYGGWRSTPDGKGWGHADYTENAVGSPTMLIKDNIIFNNFGYGLHAVDSNTPPRGVSNYTVAGNTFVSSGVIAGRPNSNILIGGNNTGAIADNDVFDSNYTYYSSPFSDSYSPQQAFGFHDGMGSGTVITNNYFAGITWFTQWPISGIVISGNEFYGEVKTLAVWGQNPKNLLSETDYPNNIYHHDTRPTGVKIFIRPNDYDAGRANITIYNWDKLSTVSVTLPSGILSNGDTFEVRNAANYFGPKALTGTYTGAPLKLMMTGLPVATPVGWTAPPPTGPEFNAFVLLKTSSGSPTRTPTRTRTPAGRPTSSGASSTPLRPRLAED